MPTVPATFPYLLSVGPQWRFITDGVKAGPLFSRPPLSVMYSRSQRGICSVAPLTLSSRELSRACVYLPLFVLRSPRPCRENTRRGRREGESRGAAETISSDPRRNQTSVSKSTVTEQRVAANSRLVTSNAVWGGPEVSTVVDRGH